MAAAATLLDVLVVDAAAEIVVEGVEQVAVGVAVVAVRHEVHVVAGGRLLDGVDGVGDIAFQVV